MSKYIYLYSLLDLSYYVAYDEDMNNYHRKISFQTNDIETAYYIESRCGPCGECLSNYISNR